MGIATAILFLALPMAAQMVEDNRVVTKRFPVTAGAAPEIAVAIVTGGIRVTASSGNEIVMNAKVHYEAPDAASLAELQKRVRLETEQSGNNVWIGTESDEWDRGNGSRRPRELGWRNRTPPSSGSSGEGGRRSSFRHDIELQVPRTAHLKLRTVNGGSIEIDGVSGEFDLNNVNGGIEVKRADGFGRANTVNGPVSIDFARHPSGATSVKTINGKVHLYFPTGLNADFQIKTYNGKIYSDFALAGRASTPEAIESSNGMKRIWRSNAFSNTRAGRGGLQIQIDGFNGDIHILEKKN